jgi:hypothetical protein
MYRVPHIYVYYVKTSVYLEMWKQETLMQAESFVCYYWQQSRNKDNDCSSELSKSKDTLCRSIPGNVETQNAPKSKFWATAQCYRPTIETILPLGM